MHLRAVSFHPEKYPVKDPYPFHLPIFHHGSRFFLRPLTFFVGENGTGIDALHASAANAAFTSGRKRRGPADDQSV